MRAMILAAGRGERMGALTKDVPKPLLRVGPHHIIDYAIYHLKQAGIHEIVINVSYQAEKIKAALGEGERYGVAIAYSEEPVRLETGGGILQALPLLGNQPFIVMSSDVISDYPLQRLLALPESLGHLIMVDNPAYHPQGDFGLCGKQLDLKAVPSLTYGNIAVFRPELFANCHAGHFRLSELLLPAIKKGLLTGEHFQGIWHNIGTPQDLQRAREDSNLRPLASETNTLSS